MIGTEQAPSSADRMLVVIVPGTRLVQQVGATGELGLGDPVGPEAIAIVRHFGRAGAQYDYLEYSWSGENSERARREAGESLAGALKVLERQGSYSRISLVSHSHGGAVIWEALVTLEAQRRPLRKLHSWVSVGAPFLVFRPILHSLQLLLGVIAVILLGRTEPLRPAMKLFASSISGVSGNVLVSTWAMAQASALLFVFVGLCIVGWRDLTERYRALLAKQVAQRYRLKLHFLASQVDEAHSGIELARRLDQMFLGTPASTSAPGHLRLTDPGRASSFESALERAFSRFGGWTRRFDYQALANSFVNGVVRASLVGDDRFGLKLHEVRRTPHDHLRVTMLADEHEQELTALAEEMAGVTLTSIRTQMGQMAREASPVQLETLFANYQWRELVHTSYFRLDRIGDQIVQLIQSPRGGG